MDISKYEVFIVDLDGCVYSGNKLNDGALEMIDAIVRQEKKIYFLSNNSTHSSEQVKEKLINLGVEWNDEMTLHVATEYTAKYILHHYGECRLKVVGSEALKSTLRMYGHKVVNLEENIFVDFLVVGRDTEFSYEKLNHAGKAIERGAKILACNMDISHPGADGFKVAETGVIVEAIKKLTGQNQVESVGKPNVFPYSLIISEAGENLSNYLMIGDNFETDVKGAKLAGIDSVWLYQDFVNKEKIRSASQVYLAKNIKELLS